MSKRCVDLLSYIHFRFKEWGKDNGVDGGSGNRVAYFLIKI